MPIPYVHAYELNRYVSKDIVGKQFAQIGMGRSHKLYGSGGFKPPNGPARWSMFFEGLRDDHGIDIARDIPEEDYEIFRTTSLYYGLHSVNHTPLSVSMEIEYRITENDVRSARKSADILQRLLDGQSFAFVVGCHIESRAEDLTQCLEVRYVQIPDLFYHADPQIQ